MEISTNNITKVAELEMQRIINQRLYDIKAIDYNSYQKFANFVLAKIKKIKKV